MAKGPTAESMPRTNALRKKADFMENGFRSSGRRAEIEKTACPLEERVKQCGRKKVPAHLGPGAPEDGRRL
jgi:hypothetical protein